MPKISLKSIKRENIRLVLEAIARNKYTTKLEISEATNLSVMTVSKLVKVLLSGGIITSSMCTSQKLGRRAQIFKIKHDWLVPVFDISTRTFKFMITNLEGEIIDEVSYLCNDDPMYISNEFVSFLKRTLELLKKKYKNKKLLGIAVSIRGVYDEENDKIISSTMPELSSIKLMQNISKIFKTDNVVILSSNRLAALGLVRTTAEANKKTVACVTVNEDVECTVVESGKCFKGSNNLSGRLGDLKYNDIPCHEYVRKSQNVDDIFLLMIDLLKSVAVFYDPDVIYLCSEKFVFYPAIKDKIYYSLINELSWPTEKRPELVAINSSTFETVSGIITQVVDNWLDKLIEE